MTRPEDTMAQERSHAKVGQRSAREVAHLLGLPEPTEEQIRVIEAPLEPALVVAGAGSGKTETMASRIVWLLANGYVRVSEVLGLTFTRKAAGELSERVRRRVSQLRQHDGNDDDDVLDVPTISTYNAFASSLFHEYGRHIGREPDVTLITAASAWTLAREVVIASDDERLGDIDKSVDQITSAVVRIAHALGDNDAAERTDEIERYADAFSNLTTLPINDDTSRKKVNDKDLVDAAENLSLLPVLVEHARRFDAAKRERGFIEFSDQVSLALEITRRISAVPEEYRRRYRIVILDEYQDTSVVQTELLARLFAGHGVMAVGDPNQSIYGWRGASASNLARFSEDFSGGQQVGAYALSTSWRNARTVLTAANELVRPLPELPDAPVRRLSPAPTAGDGTIEIRYPETVNEEADAVAQWLSRTVDDRQTSAALLCRSLKNIQPFVQALDEYEVPYHVLGLSGLLEQPVIVDLISALHVLSDPGAGSELIRLLTGARWRIGTKDIAGLKACARWLAERDMHQQPIPAETRRRMRESVADDDTASLVDALDFVTTAPDGHRALAEISDVGVARMRECGQLLADLRRRSGLAVNDLVDLVVRELDLDIEVAANAGNSLGGPSLEAFSDQISAYLAVSERGELAPFLAWLAEAERQENLSPRTEDPEPGTVQILTIHGAKGLEWDAVVIPRVVAGELPSPPRSKRGWLAFGHLPYAFRGDQDDLPELAWRGCQNQQDFVRAYASFADGIDEQSRQEQRRLAYVALTRARECALLTGSFWASQKAHRAPSAYLEEIAAVLPDRVGPLPEHPENDENPLETGPSFVAWPRDPLGARRSAVTHAADQVRSADPDEATEYDDDIELLLAERRRRAEDHTAVVLPRRVPASRFKDYVADPEAVARAARRPMPERPFRQTRLGTLFHSWVEERSERSGNLEMMDADMFDDAEEGTLLPAERDELEALEALKETFLASPWGDRRPVEVEKEINFVLAGQVIVCKLDAVYSTDDGYQIVDWKTGKSPSTSEEAADRQLQLQLYRIAYAKQRDIPPETIDAVLYYVAEDRVLRPDHVSSEEELRELWSASVLSE